MLIKDKEYTSLVWIEKKVDKLRGSLVAEEIHEVKWVAPRENAEEDESLQILIFVIIYFTEYLNICTR